MKKNTRAYRIHKAALDSFEHVNWGQVEHDRESAILVLTRAMADMLAEATKKPEPKSKPKPLVAPQKAFEILRSSGAIDCDPVDNRWFGRLGKELAALKLTEPDLQLVANYLADGGWVGARPVFGTVIRYLPDLAARAKGQPSPTGKKLNFI